MRYSCRAIVGHGQVCEPNYQCDACAAKQKYIPRIEKLEADQEDLNRICNRYAARIDKLEAVLAHIYAWYPISVSEPLQTIKEISIYARKALEEKND